MTRKTWAGDSPYNMLDRNLKRMGLTMLIGAILDVAIAVVALAFPSWLTSVMGIGTPQDAFMFSLWPLVHLVFPCFCVMAWMDTKRNVAIVSGAILARLMYALFMFISVLARGVSWSWAVVGGVGLALAVAHYVFLRLSDFGFWEVFSRAGNPPGMRK